MKNQLSTSPKMALVTIPVEAEITLADCKAYSKKITGLINDQVVQKMIECGISPNSVFADIWPQPFITSDANPYKILMNVLKQFANIASGGYTATLQLEAAMKEIDRLNGLVNQLTQ